MVLELNNIKPSYKIEVNLEFGTLSSVMNWCRNQCEGSWHISDFHSTDQALDYEGRWGKFSNCYQFIFDNERDYITFALRFQ